MENMKHLSVVDGAFLHLETPEMPMHVGSVHPSSRRRAMPAAGSDRQTHVASRMHLAPVFTRARADAVRPGQSGLDRRRRHRPRLPHALRRAAQAGHRRAVACPRRRAPALEPARPQPSAVGVLRHRGAWPTAGWRSTAKCITRRSTARPGSRWQHDLRPRPGAAQRSSRRGRAAATATSSASPNCSPPGCRTSSARRPRSGACCPSLARGGPAWRARPGPRAARSGSAPAAGGSSHRRRRSTCRSPTSARSPACRCRCRAKRIGKALGASINDVVLWL